MLMVIPFDKGTMPAIEKAIRNSDLGINPSNDGSVIRLVFPQLTEGEVAQADGRDIGQARPFRRRDSEERCPGARRNDEQQPQEHEHARQGEHEPSARLVQRQSRWFASGRHARCATHRAPQNAKP